MSSSRGRAHPAAPPLPRRAADERIAATVAKPFDTARDAGAARDAGSAVIRGAQKAVSRR
jgi:hypothetical protein